MPDPVAPPADSELRAHVERALSGHYELDSEIGRGGMGIVYRARDKRLKRTVAIKILPPELAFRSEIKTRFLREAETAAQLSHPNIVPIYTVDESDGLVYFVMAYIHGDNLAKRLHDRGVMGVDETRRILREVADALAYAHERGVIHRDIKPDNILLDAESGRPMVTDFGIARAVSDGADSRLTATGIAIGTPAYMSPEQAAGEREVDGRSDLYSLGILAYQMLTGEPPFQAASTPAMLVKHISERPVPVEQRRTDVPEPFARAVMLLLEKDPASRFPSATALVVALDGGEMPAPRPSAATGAESSAGGQGTSPGYGLAPLQPMSPAYAGHPGTAFEAPYIPTATDLRRWEAEPVQRFRKKLAPYLYVNAVIVIASVVGDSDFFGLTVLWSIYMAFKYARLWADGYDWRDVFRQPRDRELIEVFEDLATHVRAIFDPKQRQQLRAARQARRIARRSGALPGSPGYGGAMPGDAGATAAAVQAAGRYAPRIQQAIADRDEIIRLVDSMAPADKARVPDVSRSAVALQEKVQALAVSLADLERTGAATGADAIETEIAKLEGAANPLDRVASEERVRRLAYLKRQRRAVADISQKREVLSGKLETCVLALQNMKLDVLRLRAGAQTHQQVTTLATNALNLADSVDSALYVADEMGRLTRPANGRTSAGSAAGRG